MNTLHLDYASRAMLVTLHISQWSATRTDRAATEEVARNHGVNARRAGRYQKHAIDVKYPTFAAVGAAASELRRVHYWHTLPWAQDGARILPAQAFLDYGQAINAARAKLELAVDEFVASWPVLVQAAQAELNGLFNPRDYPDAAALRGEFGVRTGILPLPSARDFRVQLAQDAIDTVRADIDATVAEGIATAMREPFHRVREHLRRMAERLSQPDAIFRDSLVEGLRDLAAVLPSLNLTGDPALVALESQLRDMLDGLTAQALREDKQLRAQIAVEAATLEATILQH